MWRRGLAGLLLLLASPAAALDCPTSAVALGLRRLSDEDAARKAADLIRTEIAQVPFVAVAVPVSATYLGGADNNSPRYIVRYRVITRYKGPDRKHVTVLHLPWCDGDCVDFDVADRETVLLRRSLRHDNIVVAGSLANVGDRKLLPKGRPLPDFVVGPCPYFADFRNPVLRQALDAEVRRLADARASADE